MKNDNEINHLEPSSEPPGRPHNANGEGYQHGEHQSSQHSMRHQQPLDRSQLGQSEDPRPDMLRPLLPAQRELAFDVIRECRKVLVANDAKKPPCAASKADYDRKFRRLTKGMSAPEPKPDIEAWTMRLAKYIDAPTSFRANHAAFCYGLRETIREGLAVQDRLQRQGASEFNWIRQVVLLKSLMQILAHVQASTLGSSFWTSKFGKRRHGTSKKKDLKAIARKQPNWSSIMVSAMKGTGYLDATLVSDLAGPRPEELAKGVVIERDGPDTFVIVINGAKVRDVAGQPWRRLVFSNDVLPAAWKIRLEADASFVISVHTAEAYSQSMSRVSRRVLPGLPVVTPNLFRHAFTDRLRDHGFPTDKIAAAMGHSVAETQALYGGRAGGGKRRAPNGKAPISVDAARPVRPLDSSGLEGVIGRGRAKKQKKPSDKP